MILPAKPVPAKTNVSQIRYYVKKASPRFPELVVCSDPYVVNPTHQSKTSLPIAEAELLVESATLASVHLPNHTENHEKEVFF